MQIKRLQPFNHSWMGWLAACLLLQLTATGQTQTDNYFIRTKGLSIRLSGEGRIIGIKSGNEDTEKNLIAFSSIEGCSRRGNTVVHKNKNGSIEFINTFVSDSGNNSPGNSCTLTERFTPTGSSIRWELEIMGGGKPWSRHINTTFEYPATAQTRFWTAWGSPPYDSSTVDRQLQAALHAIPGGSTASSSFVGKANNQWVDPLQAVPFIDTSFYYGLPYFSYEHPGIGICPFQGNLFCIPMCSVLEPEKDAGITIALSPEDDIIDLVMKTRQNGTILFSRLFNRISQDRPLKFSMDIISQPADWRAGMEWMTTRYSGYFLPKSKQADRLAGTGAYASSFEVLDPVKLRSMDFSTNWQSSFDFPYMGMFLPPVKKEESWKRLGGSMVSIEKMENYARKMKRNGFHVLNYFNVTEFGTDVKYPAPGNEIIREADWWKDCNTFLYKKLPHAILRAPLDMKTDKKSKTQPGGPIYTWMDGIAMDCGDPAYKNFLLQQARRHILGIPDADGICIDRLDWLRMFNEHADDGRTWFGNKPARSLVHSFKQLMDTLGPMMHRAGKSILVNNHDKRLDVLKEADGIFDEFTYAGAPLNLSALLCVEKPALGWTDAASTVSNAGADNFFQKYLYMGVFPMCPYPDNDHSIRPDSTVDGYYITYAPLLRLLHGRKWVLKPHVISVENDLAKVNLFATPGGFTIPVVYGKTDQVRVVIDEEKIKRYKKRSNLRYQAWYPDKNKARILSPVHKGNLTYLDVPLVRGCAMIAVTQQP